MHALDTLWGNKIETLKGKYCNENLTVSWLVQNAMDNKGIGNFLS